MKLVFVDNLLLDMSGQPESVSLNPHLGLLSLIAVAEGCGHSAVLYDPKLQLSRDELALDETLYRACATQILELSPNIVGFTSLGCNFICTLKIAEYINQFDPNVQIILGGPHATILHREILERFPVFDLVVRHEGEVPLQKTPVGPRLYWRSARRSWHFVSESATALNRYCRKHRRADGRRPRSTAIPRFSCLSN